MNRLLLSIALLATMSTAVLAQSSSAPAVATPTTSNPSAPAKGANSFTEAQARDRIEKAGFTGVTALAKDANGVWIGKGKKDGAIVGVMLDYQGNVTSK
jgi:hypothetical protein